MITSHNQRSLMHGVLPRPASVALQHRRAVRSKVPVVVAETGGDGTKRPRSRKGKSYDNSKRRKGRPAHLRSPYDSPLRDGNRDRLIGLLTERAAKTLLCYLMETNLNVYHWLLAFLKENPIPRNGDWDDVSGETFLRTLLSMPVEVAKFETGRDPMFDNVVACGVDPRSIAQRIMEIRSQLSKEFIQELTNVDEENSILLRETLQNSLMTSLDMTGAPVEPSESASSPAPPAVKEDPAGTTPVVPTSAEGTAPADAPAEAEPKPTLAAGQLPPEVEALLKSAYPDGQTPQNLHPEILELLQQPGASVTAANAAAPVEATKEVAELVDEQQAPQGDSATAAQDLLGTLEGDQATDAGSSADLVITNVAGQKVVLGSGEGPEKVAAVSADTMQQQPDTANGKATGEAASGEVESA